MTALACLTSGWSKLGDRLRQFCMPLVFSSTPLKKKKHFCSFKTCLIYIYLRSILGSPSGSVVKNPPANAVDVGLIPGPGRSPGEWDGNPLQYSFLDNPRDRGACQAIIVLGVTKSWMQLSDWTTTKSILQTLPRAKPSFSLTRFPD